MSTETKTAAEMWIEYRDAIRRGYSMQNQYLRLEGAVRVTAREVAREELGDLKADVRDLQKVVRSLAARAIADDELENLRAAASPQTPTEPVPEPEPSEPCNVKCDRSWRVGSVYNERYCRNPDHHASPPEPTPEPEGVRVVGWVSEKYQAMPRANGLIAKDLSAYYDTPVVLQSDHEAEVARLEQRIRNLEEGGIGCTDCDDTGWREDRTGRHVCVCITETEPWQQKVAEIERLERARSQADQEARELFISAEEMWAEITRLKARIAQLSDPVNWEVTWVGWDGPPESEGGDHGE